VRHERKESVKLLSEPFFRAESHSAPLTAGSLTPGNPRNAAHASRWQPGWGPKRGPDQETGGKALPSNDPERRGCRVPWKAHRQITSWDLLVCLSSHGGSLAEGRSAPCG
jgi:hypothetical protein